MASTILGVFIGFASAVCVQMLAPPSWSLPRFLAACVGLAVTVNTVAQALIWGF